MHTVSRCTSTITEKKITKKPQSQKKSFLIHSCVGSEGHDQSAHQNSLTWAFVIHLQTNCILWNVSTKGKDPEKTVPMYRLISICTIAYAQRHLLLDMADTMHVVSIHCKNIAPCMTGIQIRVFLISPWNRMLWVLIRSTSNEYQNKCFHWEIRNKL